jgi:hypothetical protein
LQQTSESIWVTQVINPSGKAQKSLSNLLFLPVLAIQLNEGYVAYFAEIGRLFGMKTAGCSGKSATPIDGAGLN